MAETVDSWHDNMLTVGGGPRLTVTIRYSRWYSLAELQRDVRLAAAGPIHAGSLHTSYGHVRGVRMESYTRSHIRRSFTILEVGCTFEGYSLV